MDDCDDCIDDFIEQTFLMFRIHRQQTPKPVAEIPSVTQKEKQRKQGNDEIDREKKNVLGNVTYVSYQKYGGNLGTLNQRVLPIDLEHVESKGYHFPPTEKPLHPRLFLPYLDAVSSHDLAHGLHQL